ncbi:MAG: hypothetical protein HY286_09290 [Planctomycetes bacterium]|nr:hypothetical protein [Planctomycetota bacterium]
MNISTNGKVVTQAADWSRDPAQRAEFLERLQPKIEQHSRWWASHCRIFQEWRDVAQEVRLELCERLDRFLENGEHASLFSLPTPEQAADVAIKTYIVQHLARDRARSRRTQSHRPLGSMDEAFEIHSRAAPTEQEWRFMEFIEHFFNDTVPNLRLTRREHEVLRQLTIQGLGAAEIGRQRMCEAAAIAGIATEEIRACLDEDARPSRKNRDALSRLREKLKRNGLALTGGMHGNS